MRNVAGSPTLNDVSFRLNDTAFRGGAMYNVNMSAPRLAFVDFGSNRASAAGAGMANESGSAPEIIQAEFFDNVAPGGQGGAMWNGTAAHPSLTNVTFALNSAGQGGGVYNASGTGVPSLVNVSFGNNSATTAGGAIYNASGSPLLRSVLLWGDSAPSAAEMTVVSGTPDIAFSTIQGGCPMGRQLHRRVRHRQPSLRQCRQRRASRLPVHLAGDRPGDQCRVCRPTRATSTAR